MSGPATSGFQFTRMLDAGPVHCSVWSAGLGAVGGGSSAALGVTLILYLSFAF